MFQDVSRLERVPFIVVHIAGLIHISGVEPSPAIDECAGFW
jgi:hypothetical protein